MFKLSYFLAKTNLDATPDAIKHDDKAFIPFTRQNAVWIASIHTLGHITLTEQRILHKKGEGIFGITPEGKMFPKWAHKSNSLTMAFQTATLFFLDDQQGGMTFANQCKMQHQRTGMTY